MPQTRDAALLAGHIDALCGAHGITVHWYTGDRRAGRAQRRTRSIRVAPVTTEWRYAVALHEIGHLVGPGRSGRRLEQEAAAWRFVLDTAARDLSAATWQRAFRALLSYVLWAERALVTSRRRIHIPGAADARFWDVYHDLSARAFAEDAQMQEFVAVQRARWGVLPG